MKEGSTIPFVEKSQAKVSKNPDLEGVKSSKKEGKKKKAAAAERKGSDIDDCKAAHAAEEKKEKTKTKSKKSPKKKRVKKQKQYDLREELKKYEFIPTPFMKIIISREKMQLMIKSTAFSNN